MDTVQIITCPNCGASPSNHSNCEYCGSKLNNTFVFPGLENELKKNILLQKQGASTVCTDVDWQELDGISFQFAATYMLGGLDNIGISSCVNVKNGSVHEKRFKQLDIFRLFTIRCIFDDFITYSIDYGEDYIDAALFFTVIAEEVFGHTTDSTITFNTWHDNA